MTEKYSHMQPFQETIFHSTRSGQRKSKKPEPQCKAGQKKRIQLGLQASAQP